MTATPLKVLHLCQRDDPKTGGAPRVAAEYVKRMAALGVDAKLVFVYGARGYFDGQMPGLCHHLQGSSSKSVATNLKHLYKLFHHEKPHIVHHHDGLVWTRLCSVKCPNARIVSHGHLHAIPSRPTFRNRFSVWVQRTFCDLLICVSSSVAKSWRAAGMPDSKLSIVSNGVDTKVFTPASIKQKRNARRQYDIPPERKVISFVGRLDNRMKGCDDFLRVVAALPDEYHGLVVGEGPDGTNLRNRAERLGIQSRMTFAGLLNSTTQAYHASDVFLMTSHYEPFGLVVLEATACGLPVITLPSNGGVRQLTEQVGGTVLETRACDVVAGEVMSRIAREASSSKPSQSTRHQMVKDQFCWDRSTGEIVAHYRALILDGTAHQKVNRPKTNAGAPATS